MIDWLLFFVVCFLGTVLAALFQRRVLRPTETPEPQSPPPQSIVVDGSNVMHWGGDASAKVLNKVLRAIEAKGFHPIVFFDANVGYVLGNRYADATAMSRVTNVPAAHICVVPKGMTADEALLGFAEHHGLRVVSNDRYRDWRVAFPHLNKKGSMVRGSFQNGAVTWRGTL